MTYVLEPHGPGGMASIALSIERVRAQIARDFRDPLVIQWARNVIAGANLPGERGRPNPDDQIAALFADLKRRTVFVKDPHNTEAVGSTKAILCLDPQGACLRGGDCDDMLVVMGAGALAIGIPVRLCTRTYAKQKQGHIVLQYDSAPRGASVWKCLDPSTEHGRCSGTAYLSETITEIDVGGPPMFVGIGEVPETLGDTTTPATMNATDAQGWIAMLSAVQTELNAAAARLQANAQAYANVRADLGLQPVDPTPAPEAPGTPAGSPLVAYINSVSTGQPVWTQEAQAAEQKLLSTAQFLSSAIGDGLTGARSLFFQNGDLFVSGRPGDPYGVQLLPGQNGTPVLQYVDNTGAAQGTVGLLPIVIGAIAGAVAVVSLAAAYAVSKYCDYLAQAHHDDAMTKVSDNQTQLIASGKETPDQAAVQLKALEDLAAAAPANPANSPSTSTNLASIAKWLAVSAVAIGGVMGLVALARVAESFAPRRMGAASPTPRLFAASPRRAGRRRRSARARRAGAPRARAAAYAPRERWYRVWYIEKGTGDQISERYLERSKRDAEQRAYRSGAETVLETYRVDEQGERVWTACEPRAEELSPGEARRQKQWLERERRRAEKERDRETLQRLKRDAKTTREDARGTGPGARRECVAARKDARRDYGARRAELLAQIDETRRKLRTEADQRCSRAEKDARDRRERARLARVELEKEKEHRRAVRRIQRGNRQRQLERGASLRPRERHEETDEEVRTNLPPELVALFDRVGRGVRGSVRKSRTEAFLEYVEENPDEAIAVLDAKTDALVAELERQERYGERRRIA